MINTQNQLPESAKKVLLKGPILIIGTGLIGGSLGLALRQADFAVYIRDSSPGTTKLAYELGVGTPYQNELEIQLVVVATPPDVTGETVLAALEEFPTATVVDVASVKETIANEVIAGAKERNLDITRYVGCHPMAGREISGVISARGDLFRGRPFVIVPTQFSSPGSIRLAWQLGLEIDSTLFEIGAATHDEAVAYVSHVPQLVSSLLAAQLPTASESALSLSGQGLRDTTRIAASDPRLWVEILSLNAAQILPILHSLRDEVDEVVAAFDQLIAKSQLVGSRAVLARTIAKGNKGVKRIPGKHGTGHDAFFKLAVLVPDKPGELAKLLQDLGEAEINLEDLRLEHSLGQAVGIAHISVNRRDEAKLLNMLSKRGWARAGDE